MEIRPRRETDDRTAFRSGDPDLDRFFAKYAGQNQFRHHLGVTHVAVDDKRIIGYATVAAGMLETEDLRSSLRKKLPGYPLPVLRLARLAVDSTAQDRGVGKALLRHCFLLAVEMSERFGCVGMVVDAKPSAVDFYARFGFSSIEVLGGRMESRPEPRPMFLPLDLLVAAVSLWPATGSPQYHSVDGRKQVRELLPGSRAGHPRGDPAGQI
jgi:predicted N-acetyltransferase YhbS